MKEDGEAHSWTSFITVLWSTISAAWPLLQFPVNTATKGILKQAQILLMCLFRESTVEYNLSLSLTPLHLLIFLMWIICGKLNLNERNVWCVLIFSKLLGSYV